MGNGNGLPVRATGLLVIEVRNSNPNGDPDQESDPRTRSHDRRGVISGVSFKRKVRDLVGAKAGPVWSELAPSLEIPGEEFGRFDILESRGRDRSVIMAALNTGDSYRTFHERYWDARVFGNTFLEKEEDKEGGQGWLRTGVINVPLGISVAPVRIERMTNTKMAEAQEGKSRGMAPLGYRVVEHGVYCMPFLINPSAAHRTFCTRQDVELFLRLLPYAYPHTASHIRPCVEIRHAWYVEHKSRLGSCSDFAILDALTPHKKLSPTEPSTSWSDYVVPTCLGELAGSVAPLRDLVAER